MKMIDRRTLYNFLTDIGYTGDVDEKINQKNFSKNFSNNLEILKKKNLIF